MKLIKISLLALALGLNALALAAGNSKKKSGTDLSFEDLLVQGRYHFSNESVVTVEEEKVFSKLLKIRKDFDDRVKDSSGQN